MSVVPSMYNTIRYTDVHIYAGAFRLLFPFYYNFNFDFYFRSEFDFYEVFAFLFDMFTVLLKINIFRIDFATNRF